ncbi:hypothetical protein BDF21DRAFT_417294 [Thamnidium elegans]|nr:hypothetical protein BDF21DRAFT_417294 [Thamnidium elegans]
MFKKVIQNSLLKPNPGAMADVVCSEFISCTSCIAQEGCGYCANIAKCVSGGWFGTLDKACGLNDYYYHQCHMSTLPLGIICIVLMSIAALALLVGMGIICCCLCCKCCQEDDTDEDEGEDRPLLGNRYLKRSSTYYQWNRPPPVDDKNKKVTPADELPESSLSPEQNTKNWEDRRTALLKKYARES